MASSIELAGVLQDRDAWSADGCTVAGALSVLGTRASLLLLREAFYGATRFDEFVRRVGISEPSASTRLRELVAAGLLEREDYRDPGQRTRRGYRLTQMGEELFPVIVSLMRWGDRWTTGERGDGRVELRHQDCGARVGVEVRCAEGHEVGPDEVELRVRRPDGPPRVD